MIIGIRNSVLQRIPIKAACNGYYLRWWYNGWHYWFFLPGDHTINTEGERYFTLSTRTITMSSGQVTREQAAAIRTIFFTKEVYLLGIAGWMEIRIDPGTPEIYNNMVAGTEIEITAHIGSREISYASGYTPVPDLPVVAPSEPVMCELIIGTQIWACFNVDTDYPGSKVYGDDETKRSVFGGLYNWTQIMASGFCPEGWHVPTLAEWQTLINYLGGDATAGGHLKSIEASHWNAPNTGADDSVGFNARGAGVGLIDYWTHLISYAGQKGYAYLWTADDEPTSPTTHARVIRMTYDSAEILKTYGNKLTEYLSVRLVKNSAYIYSETLTDKDGNQYSTAIIGSHIWITANFKCTQYGNGQPIPNLPLVAGWTAENGTPGHDGAYVWYNNDINNKEEYGALYNWYAIDNVNGIAYLEKSSIQQTGWRVPNVADWTDLADNLGGDLVAGASLKEIGLAHWDNPNLGATNSSKFTGVGGGQRDYTGAFKELKEYGYHSEETGFDYSLNYNLITLQLTGLPFKSGRSLRLVRDLLAANYNDGDSESFDPVAPVPVDLYIYCGAAWSINVTNPDIIVSKTSGTYDDHLSLTVIPGAISNPLGNLVISCPGASDISITIYRMF